MTEVRLADDVSEPPADDGGEWRSLAEVLGVELERIERLGQVAWRLYDERRFREAAAVFRGLTVLDPENIDLYRGCALAAAADQDLLAATEAIDQALLLLDGKEDRDPDRAQLLALRAAFLYRSGRRREAVESAEASLARAPGAPWADALRKGLSKATASLAKARPDVRHKAEALKEHLQERLGEVAAGHRSLAWAIGYGDAELIQVFQNGAALLDAGHPFRARRIFEGLVALDARVPLFHLAVGAAWDAIGDVARAAEAYDQAVEIARAVEEGADLLADALLRRARHFARQGQVERAVADLDEALALGQDVPGDDVRARARALKDALAKSAPNPPPPSALG